jgi:hypothetical protein
MDSILALGRVVVFTLLLNGSNRGEALQLLVDVGAVGASGMAKGKIVGVLFVVKYERDRREQMAIRS